MGIFKKDPNAAPKTAAQKKKTRRIIRTIVIIVILAIIAFFAYTKFFKKGSSNKDVLTDFVHYGSITSVVEGSGVTKTKNTETLSLSTSGTCTEVFVTEGQQVEAGDKLFTIESSAAKNMLESAKKNYEGYQKRLSAARKDIAGVNLSPKFSGKIVDVVKLESGDEVSKGMKLATLIDDRTMKLTQYYSYAYKDAFYVGQPVDVSIPQLMSVVKGKVEAVNMVSRITQEGSKLFSITVSLKNEGVLTEGMVASATTQFEGDIVYPYEDATLEYNKISSLNSSVSGTVVSSKLLDYLEVEAGEVLVVFDTENADNEIFELEKALEDAEKALEKAQKNLDNCNAVAPISGRVIGLSVREGEPISENSMLVTISDSSQIYVTGTVDERNISFIQPGMQVQLDQWGTMCFGYVDTVSWSSTINNGVATYPVTIVADNWDGNIQLNSYINYKITASQSDNCLVVPLQAVRNVVLEDGTEANVLYVRNANPDDVVTLMYNDEEIPAGFDPVAVVIGISDNANVEIKEGIEDGTEVFTQLISSEFWG
ncbi:MAG: HlyD family efflux transporter periplasmic adaptor subunit [Clostridia bacterium]|nr:HlyD family efflux transporter periplasmic adaptor subunit [Clostridia bacterium]